jgi:hypothetical protein
MTPTRWPLLVLVPTLALVVVSTARPSPAVGAAVAEDGTGSSSRYVWLVPHWDSGRALQARYEAAVRALNADADAAHVRCHVLDEEGVVIDSHTEVLDAGHSRTRAGHEFICQIPYGDRRQRGWAVITSDRPLFVEARSVVRASADGPARERVLEVVPVDCGDPRAPRYACDVALGRRPAR